MTVVADTAQPGTDDAADVFGAAKGMSPALGRLLTIAALASIAAGIVHGGAIASHSEHRAAVWAFLVTAVVQLAWGAYALARPRRWVAVLGVLTGGTALAGWVIAKAHGIGFINGLNDKEPIQVADGLCAVLAGVTMTASAMALLGRRLVVPRGAVAVVSVAVLVAAAPGTVEALNHEHNHAVGSEVASAVPPHPFDPTLPIDLSGVPGVTPQEQARAGNLLAATVLLLPQWANPTYDEAHGFFSIGDGQSGTEHFVNPTFINDDVMLDPDKPESLVFDTTVTPKRLVAAMYMGTPGMTLAQVPDIGGPLTQWHIHNNLCFNGQGHVAGLTQPDGTCLRPLVRGPATPMIHVWIVPHKCGPFAALEGIGGGQIAPGQTVECDHVHGT
jgi:hypothetical protein